MSVFRWWYRPAPVRRLIAKLGYRLHCHVMQVGVTDQGNPLYKKDGKAHWHRPHNPHYLGDRGQS